jgi:hypothetical protein
MTSWGQQIGPIREVSAWYPGLTVERIHGGANVVITDVCDTTAENKLFIAEPVVLDNLKSTRFLKHEVRARAFPTRG